MRTERTNAVKRFGKIANEVLEDVKREMAKRAGETPARDLFEERRGSEGSLPEARARLPASGTPRPKDRASGNTPGKVTKGADILRFPLERVRKVGLGYADLLKRVGDA